MSQDADARIAQTRRLFDALSESYDAVGVDLFGPVADELVERLRLRVGESLLDVGCGKGQVLLSAAEALGARPSMMGTDLSPGMLTQARQRLDAAGLDHVPLMVADAQDPHLDGDPFDAIAASLVLFFLPDPLRALRSWRRLLRPGGRVGITTYGAQDPRWEDVDSVFAPFLPVAMLDARTSGTTGVFASEASLADLFDDAGFARTRTWTIELDVQFSDPDHWYAWTMSVGQRAMWASVPAEHVESVRSLATERLQRCRAEDGLIHFTQTVRTSVGFAP